MKTLAASDSGTRLYYGIPGSGKSFLARNDALMSERRIVAIDMTANRDWINPRERYIPNEVKRWLGKNRRLAIARSYDVYESLFDSGTDLIVVQASDDDNRGRIIEHAMKQEGIALVIHEAHLVGRDSKRHLEFIATQWRHHDLAAFIDSQRPAKVPRSVIELATQVHVFALVGPRDRAAVRELVDDEEAFERAHADVRAAHARGVRGVHVVLDESRQGPFAPVRRRVRGAPKGAR